MSWGLDDNDFMNEALYRAGTRVVISAKDRNDFGRRGVVTKVKDDVVFVRLDHDQKDKWFLAKEIDYDLGI